MEEGRRNGSVMYDRLVCVYPTAGCHSLFHSLTIIAFAPLSTHPSLLRLPPYRQWPSAAELNPDNLQRTVPAVKFRGEARYQHHLRALLRYKELHGHMRVPANFIVPWSRDWLEELWGLRMGSLVSCIRRDTQHADKKEELKKVGFDFAPQVRGGGGGTGWEVVKAALLAYKELEGDLLVPQKFVVPHGDPETWPKSTWGVKLGIIMRCIRHQDTHNDHKQKLLAMGFVYDKLTKGVKFAIKTAAIKKRSAQE